MSRVVVSLCGGLGNQLFQYAAARALALRNEAELVLDLAWFEQVNANGPAGVTKRSYALGPFNLPVRTQALGLSVPVAGGVWASLRRRLLRWLPRCVGGATVVSEQAFSFDASVLTKSAPVWLDGYWQSEKYFDDRAEVLRRELGVPREMSPASAAVLEQIQGCEAICLHVRRGDYVSNPSAAATHGLCSLDYYRAGLARVSQGLSFPHCFVFSDDPEWVRDNLHVSMPLHVVDVNGPDDAHQDLWLMSACRHFVIANSSFSWWAAWLGLAPEKRVVAPLRWFAAEGHNTSDLLPANWERL